MRAMQTTRAAGADLPTPEAADRESRNAAIALATTLPSDVVLYLLFPVHGAAWGITLVEAGMLLAANRLVRIAGYGWVARMYARYGDRRVCTLAVAAAAACALGNATLGGFWLLLPLRLLWGMAFAALNLSTQVLATSSAAGASARSGRSRAFIALGPVIALPAAAVLSELAGPRWVLGALTFVALGGLWAARMLPARPHPGMDGVRTRPSRPNALDTWSFVEGFALDGLFLIGLTVLGQALWPSSALTAAAVLLAVRYGSEIVLGPVGGRWADRWGAERLLVVFSLMTAVALVGFGTGWLWTCAAAIVLLRALQLPLLAPIVAMRHPGADRVRALAARSVWRDIGAGLGPLAAGLWLPVLPTPWLYGIPAVVLAAAALACGRNAAIRAGSGPS
ncbi:major facilitator superfamily MFS_1 [Paracidovorax avenae ATCC 19860]|uniref:Major facilitator superfamily MFS_1 n=1 Tax=Paracidovorax avenae (strain ATCC 19860 / DSM 7227 / CCUG 15838 / JCM 20985 / LMG 2117 / NCPPB 1011) TaxID=643561 RepID=F0Q168_PARA1|nr:major facilitator superfamily MFS_1 [Paracidovorax avenae ATCC 19860]